MAYVNIKTFGDNAAEVSVAFKVYSDAHRIAGAHYQTFPSDKPAYAKVVETAAEWKTENEKFFAPKVPEEGV